MKKRKSMAEIQHHLFYKGLVLIISAALYGCGEDTRSSGTTEVPPSNEAPGQVPPVQLIEINIAPGVANKTTDAFGTNPLIINVGSTVRWTNTDNTPHTTTSDTGVWDSSGLRMGESFDFTFTTAGTFLYHCKHFPNMVGTIEVRTTPGTSPTPLNSL
jgi:plastocyanin